MKQTGFISVVFFLMGMSNTVMAQTDHAVAKDSKKNQVQLTLTSGDTKFYNTADVQSININGKVVQVTQTAGNDIYENLVQDISFFKAEKAAGEVTRADLIGTWETKYMHDYKSYTISFTEDEMTIVQVSMYNDNSYVEKIPYTWKDGVVTLMHPATDWDEAYNETKTVSFMYDKSVLVLKSKPWEDSDIEQAEVWFREGKTPDTSDANLDGKWFCYHRGNKNEVSSGLWINGDKAEFVIGAWASRMVGPYTYENGILYLHPTEYYFGRDRDGWGYGRIDPATLECSSWEKIDVNPGYITGEEPFPETFVFFVNGDEAYGWYANEPCRFYRQ